MTQRERALYEAAQNMAAIPVRDCPWGCDRREHNSTCPVTQAVEALSLPPTAGATCPDCGAEAGMPHQLRGCRSVLALSAPTTAEAVDNEGQYCDESEGCVYRPGHEGAHCRTFTLKTEREHDANTIAAQAREIERLRELKDPEVSLSVESYNALRSEVESLRAFRDGLARTPSSPSPCCVAVRAAERERCANVAKAKADALAARWRERNGNPGADTETCVRLHALAKTAYDIEAAIRADSEGR